MFTLAAILILAAVVEALVEYLAAPLVRAIVRWAHIDDPLPPEQVRELAAGIVRYVAALVGVILCILYNADLLALAGLTAKVPVVGAVVTGLLIGRGANFINDFADRWLSNRT
jgi:hypothetical protein